MPDGNDAQTALHAIGNESGVAWLSVALLFLFLFSVYGWGRLVASFLPVPLLRLHAVSVVIGLGFLNVVGGWLNLARLATTECLVVLMLGGLLFATMDLHRQRPWARWLQRGRERKSNKSAKRKPAPPSVWPALMALLIGVIAAALLSGTSVFNIHDDFYTYIPRAVRMAQTGTLTGNPFDTLGIDGLGSQSFFHGFFLPEIDVRLLHSFDAVGCFALTLLLTAELAMWWRLPTAAGVLAVLMVTAINPQSVNVSPLYSGALVGMTALLFGAALVAQLPLCRTPRRWRYEILLALLVSLLVTLKFTLAVFAGFYLVALYTALLFAGVQRKVVMTSAATVTLAALAFVAPWVILHVPIYHQARALAAPFAEQAVIAGKYPTLVAHDLPRLLSFRRLFWGDSIGAYHWVTLLCLGTAVAAWILTRRNRNRWQARGTLAIIAAAAAVTATYLANAHLFSVDNAIRYSCPILMAGAVAGLLLLLKFHRVRGRRTPGRLVLGVCGAMILTTIIFGKSFGLRVVRVAEQKTLIAFPIDQGYARYCDLMIRDDAPYLRDLQSKMDPQTTALVWTAAPFHLDFSRNRLLTISDPGLINPATSFPAGASADALRQYLRSWGIRYVWLQLPGAGMKTVEMMRPQLQFQSAVDRKLADYHIYLLEILTPLLAQSRVVYQDKYMALFDFGSSNAIPSTPPP